MTSRYLNNRQVCGLDKLGDVYFPGDGTFPSFSACGCIEQVDVALEGLPDSDRNSLKTLLSIVGCAPRAFSWLLVQMAERGADWPGQLGVGMRFLRLGLRGVVTSLYYSGETGRGYTGLSPLDAIEYKVQVFTADVDEREQKEYGGGSGMSGSVAACHGLNG